MTTRQLEPTPGWCERAVRKLRDMIEDGDAGGYNYEWLKSTQALLLEHESAKPAPEPLPHEIISRNGLFGERCGHCLRILNVGDTWLKEPCPARNPKPEPFADLLSAKIKETEKKLTSKLANECYGEPAAKDAELPRVPFQLIACSHNVASAIRHNNGHHDVERSITMLIQELLAEVNRRIEAHALVDGEDTIPRIGQIAREVAREEIGKARIQVKRLDDGWDDYNFGRIVPGDKA